MTNVGRGSRRGGSGRNFPSGTRTWSAGRRNGAALTGITGTGGVAVDADGTHRIWFDDELGE